jgi:hypothetical protein
MQNLTFSDSAKFAQAALNFVSEKSLQVSHSFFSTQALEAYSPGASFPANFLPFPSWVLSFIFKILPANDVTIAILGMSFFILSAWLVFSIGKKLHSTKAATVSTVIFVSSIFFQEYALNFSSEILFTFLVLLFVRTLLLNGKLKLTSLIPLSLLFITRQQAVLVLASAIIASYAYFICGTFPRKQKIRVSLLVMIGSLIFLGISMVDVSSIFSPAKVIGSFHMSTGIPQGSYLRGASYSGTTFKVIVSKVFYNIYNFAKAPERLVFPLIPFLFLVNLFIKHKNNQIKWFNLFTLIILSSFVLAASATLPNARYIHPIIPLVMISAGIGLVKLVKNISPKLQSLSLVVLMSFIIFPTLGHFTLDARARAQQFNIGKPPAHKQISSIMAENIPKGRLIITNLDAWAAWYFGLTTMWFPLEINMLEGYQDKVDYIVITNYKEDDGDFALGEWQGVVYQPENIQNQFLQKNYKVLKTFVIQSSAVYDNRDYQGTILIRK